MKRSHPDDGSSPTEPRWSLLLLVAAVSLPFLVALVRAFTVDWSPVSDFALIELHTSDVASELPLLGPYSRFGWNHPGPWLFYLLAAPYRAAGSASEGLLAGAAILNCTSAVATVVVARRRGGLVLAAGTAVVLLLLLRSLGGGFLWHPWNPFVTMLPLALFVLVAWSFVEGERWALPAGAALASLLVQTHVGYAGVVVVLGLTAALLAGLAGTLVWRELIRPALWAAGITLLLWLPPLVDQLWRTGNVGEIANFFTSGEPSAGLASGLRVVTNQLSVAAPWLGAAESRSPFTGEVLTPDLPLALVGAALVVLTVTGRQRVRSASHLGVLTIALAGAAVWSVSGVVGPVLWYLARWVWVVGAVAALAVVWLAWCHTPSGWRRHWSRPVGTAVTVLAAAVGLVTAMSTGRDADPPRADLGVAVRVAAEATAETLESNEVATSAEQPVLVRGHQTPAPAIVLQLERDGFEVVVSPAEAHLYGEHRVASGSSDLAAEVVVTLGDETDSPDHDPDFELAWRGQVVGPLGATEELSVFITRP